MESSDLLTKEGVKVDILPEELRNEFVSMTKEYGQYVSDGKEITPKLIERDKKLAQKINEWLDEEVDDEQEIENKESENSGEEIEPAETTIKEKILSVADSDKVMVSDMKEILGRNPKYPLEQIEDLRLVKILFHPYYQIRNYDDVVDGKK